MKKYEKVNIFLDIYKNVLDKNFTKESKFSLGNLAIFVNYYYGNYNWHKIHQALKRYINSNNKNDFNYLIANGIKNIALLNDYESEKIINTRMNYIEELYRRKNLNTFNIIYDEYYFPEFAITMLDIIDNYENEEYVISKFNKVIKGEIRQYFTDKNIPVYNFIIKYLLYKEQHPEWLYIKIKALIEEKNVKEVIWVLNRQLYDIYLHELNRLKSNNKAIEKNIDIIKNLNVVFKEMYEKDNLFDFSFFNLTQHFEIEKLIKI